MRTSTQNLPRSVSIIAAMVTGGIAFFVGPLIERYDPFSIFTPDNLPTNVLIISALTFLGTIAAATLLYWESLQLNQRAVAEINAIMRSMGKVHFVRTLDNNLGPGHRAMAALVYESTALDMLNYLPDPDWEKRHEDDTEKSLFLSTIEERIQDKGAEFRYRHILLPSISTSLQEVLRARPKLRDHLQNLVQMNADSSQVTIKEYEKTPLMETTFFIFYRASPHGENVLSKIVWEVNAFDPSPQNQNKEKGQRYNLGYVIFEDVIGDITKQFESIFIKVFEATNAKTIDKQTLTRLLSS